MARDPKQQLEVLQELMDLFKKQTPSAPDWFRIIDHVAGTLLHLEIERTQAAIASSETESQ